MDSFTATRGEKVSMWPFINTLIIFIIIPKQSVMGDATHCGNNSGKWVRVVLCM